MIQWVTVIRQYFTGMMIVESVRGFPQEIINLAQGLEVGLGQEDIGVFEL